MTTMQPARMQSAHQPLRISDTARLEALNCLSEASREYLPTKRHAHRVAALAVRIGWRTGLSAAQRDLLERATPYHDLGKLGVPASLLSRAGPLEPHEFEIIKGHTVLGAAVLAGGDSELLHTASEIALNHHERWDGSGYPQGLRGTKIPLLARIVAVADVFDALTHERPYKPAWTLSSALSYIGAQSGQHFDPAVVEAFLGLVMKTGG